MKQYLITVNLLLGLLNVAHAHSFYEPNIMSYEEYKEYAQTKHISPYTFTLCQLHQHCFYFGAEHSWDPIHNQYSQLQSFWDDFLQKTGGKNCIVLVEGSLRNLHGSTTTTEAIRRAGGEGGYITFLAQQSGICVECPEPSDQALLQKLQKQFCEEDIAYRYFAIFTLSAIRSKKGGNSTELQEYVEACCADYQDHFSFELTIDTFKRVYERLFDTPFTLDDEDFFYQITNPADTGSIINSICRQSSIARDLHIIEYIMQLKQQGKHVFVVYGFTHAVMQERVLRALW